MNDKVTFSSKGKAPLSVWHIASEAAPFSRTGGLGDVTAALPQALASLGVNVHLVSPFHRSAMDSGISLKRMKSPVTFDFRGQRVQSEVDSISRNSGWTIYLIHREEYFDRGGLYGGTSGDYLDNADRFAYFVKAALALISTQSPPPDIIHCHDWQAALAPVYLKNKLQSPDFFREAKTVLTIHNLAYQGVFPENALATAGLPKNLFHLNGLEFYGKLNYLKGGILSADWITTVSPRYSREILTSEFGEGLDGVLREKRKRLTGILNGVDERIWNPLTDPVLPANYGPKDLSGKAVCRKDLLNRLEIDVSSETPVIGMVTRLAEQKGIDLLIEGLKNLMQIGFVLVVLGSGDGEYKRKLHLLSRKYAPRFRLIPTFDDDLAHRIEAGSDLFLMPSRFEPCGLSQMYSLKYGTIPVVRAVGGLDDSIREFDPASGIGNGFKFTEYTSSAMLAAVRRALDVIKNPDLKNRIRKNGMQEDFSWKRSARAYLQLYRRVLAKTVG